MIDQTGIMWSRVLRYVWASPNTLVGVAFIPCALLPRGGMEIIDGVLEVHAPPIASLLRHCVPIRGGATAITFGHIVLGCDARSLAAARQHERVHVRQCEVWGPAFIPAYLLASLWALVTGTGAYKGNYFERQARGSSNRSAALLEGCRRGRLPEGLRYQRRRSGDAESCATS